MNDYFFSKELKNNSSNKKSKDIFIFSCQMNFLVVSCGFNCSVALYFLLKRIFVCKNKTNGRNF